MRRCLRARVYVSDAGVTESLCVGGGCEFLEALVAIFVLYCSY